MTLDEIARSITQRLLAAREEIAQLESARQALTSSMPPVSGGRRRKPAKRGSRSRAATAQPSATARRTSVSPRRRRRSPAIGADLLESTLSGARMPLTTAELASQLGAEPGRVLPRLRELESAARVQRSGAGRSTRWQAVTDEDRIAARAAELASRP